jgi:hypothetical protein
MTPRIWTSIADQECFWTAIADMLNAWSGNPLSDRTPDLLGFQAISNLTRIPEPCWFRPQVEYTGQELMMSTDVEKIRSKYPRVRDCVMKAHRRGPASRG